MTSFAYLIPRIFIVGLIVLAAVLGADPLVRWFLMSNLETSIGSKVSIARISSDLSNGKVYLRDFSIADPGVAMENLFQADLTYLKFDYSKLLNRQIAVQAARTSHVRFGAPRTEPGNLLPQPKGSPAEAAAPIQFQNLPSTAAVTWLDQFESKFSPEQPGTMPATVFGVAKATNERWNRDFELHHEKLATVNQKIVQLVNADPSLLATRSLSPRNAGLLRSDSVGPVKRGDESSSSVAPRRFNPLRLASNQEVVSELLKETVAAIDDLKRQQLVLRQNAEADIEALDLAFKKDMSSTSDLKTDSDVSVLPETINNLLLVKFHQQAAAEAIEWFSWLNDKAKSAVAKRNPTRGVEFFSEHFLQPNLVIDQLEIDGEGIFANEHFHFAGHAYDLSNLPAGHDRPARFELRAQGTRHLHLNCVMDQRQGRDRNRLVIEFPSFDLGEQVLGSEKELLVSLSPGTKISGTIELETSGDQIIGDMELDFSNVALVVQNLHDVAGGREVEVRLNHQIASLNHFQTSTKIEGGIGAPALSLKSDLGKSIADAIEIVSRKTQQNSMLVRNQRVEEFYRSRVLPLQANIKSEVGKITGALDDQVSQAEAIQSNQRMATSRWPSLR